MLAYPLHWQSGLAARLELDDTRELLAWALPRCRAVLGPELGHALDYGSAKHGAKCKTSYSASCSRLSHGLDRADGADDPSAGEGDGFAAGTTLRFVLAYYAAIMPNGMHTRWRQTPAAHSDGARPCDRPTKLLRTRGK